MAVLRLGILFSCSGDYAALGRDCRDGAELAIAEWQGEGRRDVTIEPVFGDPGGSGGSYIEMARHMAVDLGCRHVIGTVTSQARKDVIPVMEKHDAQLWYVCPYEGFEANRNVVYTGACPNQHLLPLFQHLLPTFGHRVFLAGANYVWGWEMNRLARELVAEADGEIVGERCLPIADRDVDQLVSAVVAARPSFILSNLLGPSSHAFLRAMRDLAGRDPTFSPERCPVVSCDLTECELPEIGLGVADGQLAAAAYFDGVESAENRALQARFTARFGAARRISSYLATSYATVRLCAEAVALSGDADPAEVRAALADLRVPAGVLGPLRIDPVTHHAGLPFYLGRIAGDGFEILQSRTSVAADPYLTARRTAAPPRAVRPRLRIVS